MLRKQAGGQNGPAAKSRVGRRGKGQNVFKEIPKTDITERRFRRPIGQRKGRDGDAAEKKRNRQSLRKKKQPTKKESKSPGVLGFLQPKREGKRWKKTNAAGKETEDWAKWARLVEGTGEEFESKNSRPRGGGKTAQKQKNTTPKKKKKNQKKRNKKIGGRDGRLRAEKERGESPIQNYTLPTSAWGTQEP